MWVIKNITGGYYRYTNYHTGFNNAFRFDNKKQADSKAFALNRALQEPIFFVKDIRSCA